MKFYTNPASPFSRKCQILAKTLNVAMEDIHTMPLTDETLRVVNPLAQIPALVLDDGSAMHDSRVICEYLDAIGTGPALLPASGTGRWTALRLQALGDGVADAAFNIVMEHRRAEALRSSEWLDRWTRAIHGAADALEEALAAGPLAADLGAIAIAAAFGYVDFRLPQIDWRAGRPRLTAAFADLAARPSFVATAPPNG